MGWGFKSEMNMCMYYTPDVVNRMAQARITLSKTFRLSTTIINPEFVYQNL